MHSYSEYNSRSSSGMRGGRNNMMSNSQHNANSGNGMVHNNNNNRSRSRTRSISRSRSRSLSRRQGSCGQSSLSAHIQQQMERPRRGERDPTPLSRSAHNTSAPNLNYNGQSPPPPPNSTLPSPPRRASARTPRRTSKHNNMNPPTNVASSSPSSSEERAAIAANLAKNSFSAHRNLQKLIDEEREREYNRMEHNTRHQQQQMQVYTPPHEQQQHPVVYPPTQASSVAAVHQQPQHHRTPVNLMVGHESFNRSGCAMSALTNSTMTPLTPSTLGSNSTTSPDVGHSYTTPQIERVTAMTPGRNGNSGYNHHPQQQQQNPPQQQHRRSASPRKQPRDHLNKGTPRPPDFDEEQLNTIVTEHPDSEVAQSIVKIMAFHKRNSTPCPQRQDQSNNRSLTQSKQIVSYDAKNAAQQQQRRSKAQLLMDVMDTNDSSEEMKNRSFHSNSTAPTTASSLNSGSLFATSEPFNNNSSSSKTSPLNNSKHSQLQRQHSSSIRYLDKETLHNHLQHAPRESRVQLTRHVEKLQSENQRLNEVNLTQVNQIDTLETEVGDLLRELLRYRREFGELESVAFGGGSDGDVSSEHATAPPAVASSPFQKRHASSPRVEMNRQVSTANSNEEEEELDVVRLYVKSKSLHEEAIGRPRRATASKRRVSSTPMQNSITSAPVVSRTSSGISNASFDHNINMLKQLQLGDDSPRRCSDSQNTDASFHTAAASFHTAEESIFETKDTAKQRSFKEEKKADAHATSRWRRVSAINNEADDPQSDGEGSIDEEQLLQMQQQQEHENNHQDEASREARLKSNSLEDIFEPQNRRSCFVEQKGGSISSSRSVPSMTDTVGSCSWSCSSPESGGGGK